MVLNALKRLFKPEYRVIIEMSENGAVYIQRKNIFGRKWHYVSDVLGAIEFESVVSAFMFIDVMHEYREYEVSMLIRFDGEEFE